MNKIFKIGEQVKFVKEWEDKVKPNVGLVDKRVSKDPRFIWVKFDVPSPPANVLLVPVDKIESAE